MFTNGNTLSPGRQKGSTNKINIDIRQKFYQAYENMGSDDKVSGDAAFYVWARGHKKVFYSLFAKLAPTNLSLDIHDSRQHESFIDRMAVQMLEAEVKVIETKSQLDMGNDTIISPSNGDDIEDKELDNPINKEDFKEVVSSDKVDCYENTNSS